ACRSTERGQPGICEKDFSFDSLRTVPSFTRTASRNPNALDTAPEDVAAQVSDLLYRRASSLLRHETPSAATQWRAADSKSATLQVGNLRYFGLCRQHCPG